MHKYIYLPFPKNKHKIECMNKKIFGILMQANKPKPCSTVAALHDHGPKLQED